jgi:hypothetical protein
LKKSPLKFGSIDLALTFALPIENGVEQERRGAKGALKVLKKRYKKVGKVRLRALGIALPSLSKVLDCWLKDW